METDWITHGRALTRIGERHNPRVLGWDSFLASRIIFLYTLTVRIMVYLIPVTLIPPP